MPWPVLRTSPGHLGRPVYKGSLPFIPVLGRNADFGSVIGCLPLRHTNGISEEPRYLVQEAVLEGLDTVLLVLYRNPAR